MSRPFIRKPIVGIILTLLPVMIFLLNAISESSPCSCNSMEKPNDRLFSTVQLQAINYSLSLGLSKYEIILGRSVFITGQLYPSEDSVHIVLTYRKLGQSWIVLDTVLSNSLGMYELVWTPDEIGTYRFQARWGGDENVTECMSEIADVNVVLEDANENSSIWQFASLCVLSSAFVASLYTLFSRDTRLREDAHRMIVPLFLFCFATVSGVTYALSVTTNLLRNAISDLFQISLLYISLVLFVLSWLALFSALYKSYGRIYHMREKGLFTRFIRLNKLLYPRKVKYEQEASYEERKSFNLSPFHFDQEEQNVIKRGYSFLFVGDKKKGVDPSQQIIGMLIERLKMGEIVNYVCVDKPPSSVLERIKHFDKDFLNLEYSKKLFIVDAFTPNFGFGDRILVDSVETVRKKGIVVVSAKTLASIHSGVNRIQKLFDPLIDTGKKKPPTTMVYDGLSVLGDISGEEQLKTYFTHIIVSEKMHGMLTFFVESRNPISTIFLAEKVDGIVEFTQENGQTFVQVKKLSQISPKSYIGKKLPTRKNNGNSTS